MNATATLSLDKTWLTGLIILAFSLFIFCIPLFFPLADVPDGLFFLNYVAAFGYFILIRLNGRLDKGNNGLAPFFVFLVLSLVSCYALNRSMSIFENSVPWWTTLLIITSINYLSIPFYYHLPRWAQYISCAITGVAFIAFLYLAIYLIPLYCIGLAGAIALGIGFHAFIPLLFLIYTIIFIYRAAQHNKRILYAFGVGVAITICTAIQFTVRWSAEVRRVNSDLLRDEDNTLPHWVAVAQDCSPSTFNEHFLKAGLVYTLPEKWDFDFFRWDEHRQFHEERRHDPLIVLAAAWSGTSNLEETDRIKILESLYDSRYNAQQRLWNDDKVVTTSVKTNVELWPQLHCSYTQEELTLTAQGQHNSWPAQKEALYTFHLPEGATVSALSLWINGHEEKGVLTSRHKADSAYQQIVGYENRDPSVVHWQEGNKVVVRVFPVVPYETRRFKIGITAPLEKKDERLYYHSIYFDGPPAANAAGYIHIRPFQQLKDPKTPASFQSPLESEGTYTPDWTLSFKDPGIAAKSFQFNGQQYTTEAATPEYDIVNLQKVYLDLNKSWTHDEYASLLDRLRDKKIYAYLPADGLVPLNSSNEADVFSRSQKLQFSLFPPNVIDDKEHSLLITKNPAASPNLSDLNLTDFAKDLQTSLGTHSKTRVYNLGDELSPYLKTLKECGAFYFEKGDLATLSAHLKDSRFLHTIDQPDLVSVDPAGLLIRRTDTTVNPDSDGTTINSNIPAKTVSSPANARQTATNPATAPDHLLRLFAYNRIQKQLNGRLPGDYSNEDPDTVDSLVNTAQEAGIVSPVSSLVVLETAADYKRFNIAQSQNGLQNASLHSKGAVPEPAEWTLLLTVLALFLFVRLRSIRRQNTIQG